MEVLDEIRLRFNPENLLLMNICMGLVMFGVALELSLRDFAQLLRQPRSFIAGLIAQLLLLPALTFLLVMFLQPTYGIALGMILLACCAGGTISNMLTVMAGGNAALSVGLTASATLLSSVTTPASFAFWGNLYLQNSQQLPPISISFVDMLETVMLVVGIPLLLGMLFNHFFSVLSIRLRRYFRIVSVIIFGIFIAAAFAANFQIFLDYIHYVALIVLLHNALAYGSGYLLGQVFRLPLADKKAIAIETGIQNGGMALILIFNFFDGLGSMAMIAGWWGIWDIFSGLALAWGLSKIRHAKTGKVSRA